MLVVVLSSACLPPSRISLVHQAGYEDSRNEVIRASHNEAVHRNCSKVMALLQFRPGRIDAGDERFNPPTEVKPEVSDAIFYFQDHPDFGNKYEFVRMVGSAGVQVSYPLGLLPVFFMSASKQTLSMYSRSYTSF